MAVVRNLGSRRVSFVFDSLVDSRRRAEGIMRFI